MSKKAVIAMLSLVCWLGVGCAQSHAVDVMKDVKKAEHAVSKGAGKTGKDLKKGSHNTGSMVKKGTKNLKIKKPKL